MPRRLEVWKGWIDCLQRTWDEWKIGWKGHLDIYILAVAGLVGLDGDQNWSDDWEWRSERVQSEKCVWMRYPSMMSEILWFCLSEVLLSDLRRSGDAWHKCIYHDGLLNSVKTQLYYAVFADRIRYFTADLLPPDFRNFSASSLECFPYHNKNILVGEWWFTSNTVKRSEVRMTAKLRLLVATATGQRELYKAYHFLQAWDSTPMLDEDNVLIILGGWVFGWFLGCCGGLWMFGNWRSGWNWDWD